MVSSVQRMAAALIVTAVAAGATAARAQEVSFQKLIDERSPALVTVKYLLKIKAAGIGEQETDTEITALMIEPTGLLICSNAQLSEFTSIGGGGITATPTDIKVLIGDDTEGVPAKLLARDTELDLAWIQIEKPAEKPYVFIDFSSGAEAKIGDALLGLRRMNKYYDRVPVVGRANIGGITRKPRVLYVLAGQAATGPGQVVFSADGKPAGMTVVQLPGADEGDMDMLSRLSIGRLLSEMILPASEIVKATEKAKANPTVETETEAKPEDGAATQPAEGAAPATTP